MCRHGHEPGAPRTCSGHAQAQYSAACDAVDNLRDRQAALLDQVVPSAGSVGPRVRTKLRDLTGVVAHGDHTVYTERALVRVKRSLAKELDDQGVSADNPLRGVISHACDAVCVTRSADGTITGAMGLIVSDTRGYEAVTIHQLRAAPWSQPGTGRALLSESARMAQALNGTLSISGATVNAIGFYERMGATFANPSSHTGRWTSAGHDALAAGSPIAAVPSGRAGATSSTAGRPR